MSKTKTTKNAAKTASRKASTTAESIGSPWTLTVAEYGDCLVAYNPQNPTVGAKVFQSGTTRDNARLSFAKQNRVRIQSTRACKLSNYKKQFVRGR